MRSERYAFRRPYAWVLSLGLILALAQIASAKDAAELSKVAPEVLSKEQRDEATGMIRRDIQRRTREVNARNREAWSGIKTREQWEKYRDERIERLRRSLGEYPPAGMLNSRVTGVVHGD